MKKKILVLVVDDNPDIAEIYNVRLVNAGYEVITSLSGQDALEQAKTQQPNLIILDIAMPNMDGFEVGRRLKSDFDTRDIPIIMATAKGSREDVMRAVTELGVSGYVIKPFDIQLLLKEIDKALGKKRE